MLTNESVGGGFIWVEYTVVWFPVFTPNPGHLPSWNLVLETDSDSMISGHNITGSRSVHNLVLCVFLSQDTLFYTVASLALNSQLTHNITIHFQGLKVSAGSHLMLSKRKAPFNVSIPLFLYAKLSHYLKYISKKVVSILLAYFITIIPNIFPYFNTWI